MKRNIWTGVAAALLLATSAVAAEPRTLHEIQFPERSEVGLTFERTAAAPDGELRAQVSYRDAQAKIQLNFTSMKPAILFGGDVTSYVLWAITRGGRAVNLGELEVRDPKGSLSYSTGLKAFALLVTAESYYLVDRPSELVMFHNAPAKQRRVVSSEFTFVDLAEAPRTAMTTVQHIRWDSTVPIDLLQADKAHELASRIGAERYAPQIFQESTETLEQARKLSGKDKKMLDFSRRSVALSNVAINISERRIEGEAIEREMARRRAEMAELEQRAKNAEAEAVRAADERAAARRELERLALEKSRVEEETADLRRERDELGREMDALRAEKAALLQAKRELEREKQQLSSRLQAALSAVAETRESARGLIVNLPDILFDVNRAELKPDTRTVLAKIAGILLIMPDLQLRVEGHTDSTGSAEYNLKLSELRSRSVVDFLAQNGITTERMESAGYGIERPIADNATAEGRQKNRRVEIVIASGGSAG